jgi:hypothetical protein
MANGGEDRDEVVFWVEKVAGLVFARRTEKLRKHKCIASMSAAELASVIGG